METIKTLGIIRHDKGEWQAIEVELDIEDGKIVHVERNGLHEPNIKPIAVERFKIAAAKMFKGSDQ